MDKARRTDAAKGKGDEKCTVDFAEEIIGEAVAANASDVHLEPTAEGGQVRLRVDGVLTAPKPMDAARYDALLSRLQLLAEVNVTEKNMPQDGRIQLNVTGRPLDLRASFMQFLTGGTRGRAYGVVIRILLPEAVQLDLDKLDVPEEMRRWAEAPWGIYIVSGPTGSGKTTVLYALLKAAARPGRKVLAAENPVEYLVPGVLQAEMRQGAGLTFPVMIRSFLRQDPDVLMVTEIRDYETAVLFPAVALTGHVIFSTLHTNDASAVPRRLVDIGLEPWLVKESLKGAASLRLLRCLCPECKVPDDRDPAALLGAVPYAKEFRGAKFFRSKGCPACHGAGYRGRMAVYEVLPLTDRVCEGIGKNLSAADLRGLAVQEGLITLRHAALRKAAEGATSLDEALRVTGGE